MIHGSAPTVELEPLYSPSPLARYISVPPPHTPGHATYPPRLGPHHPRPPRPSTGQGDAPATAPNPPRYDPPPAARPTPNSGQPTGAAPAPARGRPCPSGLCGSPPDPQVDWRGPALPRTPAAALGPPRVAERSAPRARQVAPHRREAPAVTSPPRARVPRAPVALAPRRRRIHTATSPGSDLKPDLASLHTHRPRLGAKFTDICKSGQKFFKNRP